MCTLNCSRQLAHVFSSSVSWAAKPLLELLPEAAPRITVDTAGETAWLTCDGPADCFIALPQLLRFSSHVPTCLRPFYVQMCSTRALPFLTIIAFVGAPGLIHACHLK